MAYHNYFLIVLIAVLSSSFVKCAEFVPVFMWGTNKMSEHVPALHKTSQDSFKDTLLEYLKTNPQIIVFSERTLSPEDFAQCNQNGESTFVNIQRLKSEGNYVSYRPYVQNPIGAIKQLNKPVTQISISNILDSVNVPKENIWIIDLDDAKDYETRAHMLNRHDSDAVSLYNDFKKKYDNLLVLYTANYTAWVAPNEVTRVKSRNLLQAAETKQTNNGFALFGTQFLFYLTNEGTYKPESGNMINVTNASTLTTEVNAENTAVLATLTASTTTIVFNITTTNSGYWYIRSITAGSVQFEVTKEMYAPLGFSYHCGGFNLTNKERKAYLHLPGFQIQPFGNLSKFGDAYDCVGFTTIPIWSGLFVTAILLLIITFGLTMMMDIKTMDRFDDPKGKTITITASE